MRIFLRTVDRAGKYRSLSSTLCILLLVTTWGLAAAQTPTGKPEAESYEYAPPQRLGQLENDEISESSGLAISRNRPDIFWTHNDSGDRPRIFAFDRQGRDRGQIEIRDARAIDWEDMASFESDGRAWLLLGDVGDNGRRRRDLVIYLVEEPTDDKTQAISAHRSLPFHYEDGPHDCEALAWDPSSNRILLLAKETLSAAVYGIPLPTETPSEPLTARRIATLPLAMTTAFDISADGTQAVVLTYGHAYSYRRSEEESWSHAFAQRPPKEIRLPFRRQGEAICFGRDGRTLFLTSEHLPTPFWEIPPKPN